MSLKTMKNVEENLSNYGEFVKPERNLSRGEFIDNVALAESMRQYDERKEILEAEYPETPEEISVQTFLDEIESLGINRKYGQKALNTRIPIPEQQLAELRKHGGIPSMKLVFEVYANVLERRLEDTLISGFRFSRWNESCLKFIKTKENWKTKREGVIFKRETRVKNIEDNKLLAALRFEDGLFTIYKHFELSLDLKDPLFLHIFGEDIKKLNNYFKTMGLLSRYDVRYDYQENPLFSELEQK